MWSSATDVHIALSLQHKFRGIIDNVWNIHSAIIYFWTLLVIFNNKDIVKMYHSFENVSISCDQLFTGMKNWQCIKSVCLSVCPSVRPSVRPSIRYVPVPYENGLIYRHSFFSPYGSPVILVLSASNIFTTFRRGHPCGGAKYRWGIKISRDSEPIYGFNACC